MDSKALSSLSETDRHAYQIGMLVKTWANIETSLDLSCQLAFNQLGGSEQEAEAPRALKRRIKFLRKVWLLRQPDEQRRLAGAQLLELVLSASLFRHDCVHGIAIPEGDQFSVQLLDRLPNGYSPRTKLVTLDDIAWAQVDAYLLLVGVVHMLMEVCTLVGISTSQVPRPRILPGLDVSKDSTVFGKRIFAELEALGAIK